MADPLVYLAVTKRWFVYVRTGTPLHALDPNKGYQPENDGNR